MFCRPGRYWAVMVIWHSRHHCHSSFGRATTLGIHVLPLNQLGGDKVQGVSKVITKRKYCNLIYNPKSHSSLLWYNVYMQVVDLSAIYMHMYSTSNFLGPVSVVSCYFRYSWQTRTSWEWGLPTTVTDWSSWPSHVLMNGSLWGAQTCESFPVTTFCINTFYAWVVRWWALWSKRLLQDGKEITYRLGW